MRLISFSACFLTFASSVVVYADDPSGSILALDQDVAPDTELMRSKELIFKSLDKTYELDLGTLRCGATYVVTVPFQNQTERHLKITEIKTSCGCVGGRRKDEEVMIGGISDFGLVIKPILTPSRFAKQVQLLSGSTVNVVVNVCAVVEPLYLIEPRRLTIDSQSGGVALRISPNPKFRQQLEGREISVDMRNNLLTVKGVVREGGNLEVNCETRPKLKNLITSVYENLAILDSETNAVLSEFALPLEPRQRLAVLPRRLILRKTDEHGLYGTAIIAGDSASVSRVKSCTFVLQRFDGSDEWSVDAVVTSRGARLIKIKFEIADVNASGFDTRYSARLASEGETLGRFEDVVITR